YDTTYSDLKAELGVLQAEVTGEGDVNKAHEGPRKALTSRSRWKEDRQRSSRKAGVVLQKWLNAFAGFLESYLGIVGVVKAADQQYGGLAYGTLSILLGVEYVIEDALGEFAFAFPRLQMLKKTYVSPQSETLWRLVGAVYAEVIVFAQEAAIYYQKSSFSKLGDDCMLLKNVALIRKHLAEITWESETLMQHRLMEMVQENKTLQVKVDGMRPRQRGLRVKKKNEDQKSLKELRSILKFKESDKHTNIQHYKGLLDPAFADRRYGREEPCLMDWDILAEEASFHRWWNTESSSLLFLSGKNWITVNNSTLSWLSYAAVLLTQKPLQDNRNVAYYFCQANNMLTDRRRRTIQDLMASLLYQIANSQPKLLRSGVEAIRDAIASDEWNSEDEEVVLEAMAALFIEVLSTLDSDEEFTLVIDRIDQCRWSSESEDSGSCIENALF
ncbi:uncharacterized protein K441DRAFT_581561, partial [Cenococcum geophilum 1.58]|uniref:uncharacterized protein n=1 Tax=Cenococcum geophilum 1.58 TaxID=794803 RepID=UPI00358E293C